MGFDSAIGPVQRDGKKLSLLHGVRDVKDALNKYLEKK